MVVVVHVAGFVVDDLLNELHILRCDGSVVVGVGEGVGCLVPSGLLIHDILDEVDVQLIDGIVVVGVAVDQGFLGGVDALLPTVRTGEEVDCGSDSRNQDDGDHRDGQNL